MDSKNIAPRVSILLSDDERAALRLICNQDVRPPQWTMRHLILQEAQRRGIVATNDKATHPSKSDSGFVTTGTL
jgi:hypothetical protein